MNAPTSCTEVEALFGLPATFNGPTDPAAIKDPVPIASWEANNIVLAKAPGWTLYYQDEKKSKLILKKIPGIKIHRLLLPSLLLVIQEIWDFAKQQLPVGASDDDIRTWLHK